MGWLFLIFGALFVALAIKAPTLKKRLYRGGLAIFFAFLGFAMISSANTPESNTDSFMTDIDASPFPSGSPDPLADSKAAESYEQGQKEDKRALLARVDESISGAKIAGNPYKYVGEAVDLHCTVFNVPSDTFFNATCGTDADGLPVTIVVEYDDVSSLSKGQAVRVMGTVEEPMDGTNGFGGETHFPTVKAEFME